VVGRYRPAISYPWTDGWHTRAEIEIDEVLYGDPGGRKRIAWEAVTPWEYVDWIATLRYHPPPQLLERNIWALRQSSQPNKWNSCFGPLWLGPYAITDLDCLRDYYRRGINKTY
jgi:hypothetical protein